MVPAFLLLTGNWTFFNNVIDVYPVFDGNVFFILSLGVFCYCLITLLALTFSLIIPARFVLSAFILVAAATGYYADQLGIVIDDDMIRNLIETNIREAIDLINIGFLTRFFTLGVLPVLLIWWLPYQRATIITEIRYKLQTAAIIIGLVVLCMAPLTDYYASFFREHKPLRYYSNPAYPIYSTGKYISQKIKSTEEKKFIYLTTSALREPGDAGNGLVIMVVGETARADRFSLNGYAKNTNPKLSKIENIISYSDISSCGTSTIISVPCMFAHDTRETFDRSNSDNKQNLLDILKLAGVNVLWRDNNSDSKGVANRVTYEDFKSSAINPVCNPECRDIGMLDGLQTYIDQQKGDILIVLHQMGSHGPAYFKRYPPEFEKFTPACTTVELSKCSTEEINNAYDNTIVYTDFFLSKVIEFLKKNTPAYETSMLYVSDHGESLGEKNLYLHGLPYLFAPKEQTQVPVIIWVGDSSDIDYDQTVSIKDNISSHDAIFSTLLSIFEIDANIPEGNHKPLVILRSTEKY